MSTWLVAASTNELWDDYLTKTGRGTASCILTCNLNLASTGLTVALPSLPLLRHPRSKPRPDKANGLTLQGFFLKACLECLKVAVPRNEVAK
jgi:hypothetical protein